MLWYLALNVSDYKYFARLCSICSKGSLITGKGPLHFFFGFVAKPVGLYPTGTGHRRTLIDYLHVPIHSVICVTLRFGACGVIR